MAKPTDIFKEFYALIKDNISNFDGAVTSSFINENNKPNKKIMPQIVVHAPVVPRAGETMGNGLWNRNGHITIEILAFSSRETKELVEQVDEIVFNNLGSLSVQKVDLEVDDSISTMVGERQATQQLLTFNFTNKE